MFFAMRFSASVSAFGGDLEDPLVGCFDLGLELGT
jgi:hypothetical protein